MTPTEYALMMTNQANRVYVADDWNWNLLLTVLFLKKWTAKNLLYSN